MAELDSFARHVELTEFQTQASLNSRAMCAQKLCGDTGKEQQLQKRALKQGVGIFVVPFLTNRFFGVIMEFRKGLKSVMSHSHWLARFNQKIPFSSGNSTDL